MSEETCAFCHSKNYACGTTEEKMPKGDIRSPRLYQSELCREREAHNQTKRERDDVKASMAQKSVQYEIAQKELAFIKHKCNEEEFVFLDDLSSETGHPEEVLAFIRGDVK